MTDPAQSSAPAPGAPAAEPVAPKPSALARLGRRALLTWRLIVAVVVGFRGESIGLRAGNLTFITITSLVPFVALVLALVHSLNEARIDHLVMGFFDDILAPAGKNQSVDNIRRFFHVAPSRTAGSLSFFFFLVSSGVLLRHLDASLNDVWAVRRKRPLLVSIALYAGLLLAGPIVMSASLVGTDGIKRLILWTDMPYAATVIALGAVVSATIAFSLLYKLAPHAPVKWKSALTGGFVAGLAWEIARHVYGGIASLFFNANPLYGSLGIAPLFLMWVYVGWFIVLSGARLAYAFEHADFHNEFGDILSHPRSSELIATRIASLVARAALSAKPGPSPKQLAAILQLPEQRVLDLLHQLETAGLVAQKKGEVVPARDPTLLSLADISAAVGGSAILVRDLTSRHGRFESVARLFSDVDEASIEKLRRISWFDLADTTPDDQRKA